MTRKLEERIAGAFLPNRRYRTVARIDHGLIRQDQQLLVNRAQDLFERTAPKIRPSDAPGEKRITGEQLSRSLACVLCFLRSHIKRDAPRRVARSMQDVCFEVTPAESVAFAEEFIDTGRIGRAQADPGGLYIEMAIKLHIVGMHEHG